MRDLLEHENGQVRKHVNGTLYSVLTVAGLKPRATTLGFDEILRELMERCDAQAKRQYQYILKQLHAKSVTNPESDDERTDLDEEKEEAEREGQQDSEGEQAGGDLDDEEEDEDLCALLSAPPADMIGEALLCGQYMSTNSHTTESPVKTRPPVKTSPRSVTHKESSDREELSARSDDEDAPPNRPVTPAAWAGVSLRARTAPGDENLPDEMRSRPRIIRTPDYGQSPYPPAEQNQAVADQPRRTARHVRISAVPGAPTIPDESTDDGVGGRFTTRAKLARTPQASDRRN